MDVSKWREEGSRQGSARRNNRRRVKKKGMH